MARLRNVLALLSVPALGAPTNLGDVGPRFVINTTMERLEADACDAPPCTSAGVVTMNTSPWTRVSVDGERAGTTPLFRVRMLPGDHVVRFTNDEQGVAQEVTVHVEGGYLTKVRGSLDAEAGALESQRRPTEVDGDTRDLTNPAFLTVAPEPWGRVYVDGKFVGITPMFRARVTPGEHVVELRDVEGTVIRTQPIASVEGEALKLDLSQP